MSPQESINPVKTKVVLMDTFTSIFKWASNLLDTSHSTPQIPIDAYSNFRPSRIADKNINSRNPLMSKEVSINIITYLRICDFGRFCCVCSTWNAMNNSDYVWKIITQNCMCCVDLRCDSIREGVFHNGVSQLREIIQSENNAIEALINFIDKILFKNIKRIKVNREIYNNSIFKVITITLNTPAKFQTQEFYLELQQQISVSVTSKELMMWTRGFTIYKSTSLFSLSTSVDGIFLEDQNTNLKFLTSLIKYDEDNHINITYDSVPVATFMASIKRI
jgi:hypothetical protein